MNHQLKFEESEKAARDKFADGKAKLSEEYDNDVNYAAWDEGKKCESSICDKLKTMRFRFGIDDLAAFQTLACAHGTKFPGFGFDDLVEKLAKGESGGLSYFIPVLGAPLEVHDFEGSYQGGDWIIKCVLELLDREEKSKAGGAVQFIKKLHAISWKDATINQEECYAELDKLMKKLVHEKKVADEEEKQNNENVGEQEQKRNGEVASPGSSPGKSKKPETIHYVNEKRFQKSLLTVTGLLGDYEAEECGKSEAS